MKENILIANPYNEEHIRLFQQYEQRNNLSPTTSSYLIKIKNTMSEQEYKQLEQERPEVAKTIFMVQNGKILTTIHLIGEKDRKSCRATTDNMSTAKVEEKMLEELENYVFTTLGMEELIILQEISKEKSTNSFIKSNYEDLGMEEGMHVYMKTKPNKKQTAYNR